MIVYTLIVTVAFANGGSSTAPRSSIHSEHDYQSRGACQSAYRIVREQADLADQYGATTFGTCLRSQS